MAKGAEKQKRKQATKVERKRREDLGVKSGSFEGLVKTEKKLEKKRTSSLSRFRKGIVNSFNKSKRGLGNTLGKAVYKLKEKGVKHGKFVGGAASGAGLALAGKGIKKIKEHIWSHNQFDKLIWLGLFYYGLQWYFKLVVGRDVFSNIPYEFMLLNFVLALIVLIFFFKPDLTEFIGTGLLIIFYLFILRTGFRLDIPIIGVDLGMIFALVVFTAIIGFILRDICHKDIFGVILVSITFLFEIGIKIYIADIIPVSWVITILLYAPYWLILALIAGGYVEGGASKFIEFFRGIFGIVIILFIASNLILSGTTYGATKLTISEEKKEEGLKSFGKNIERIGEAWNRMITPIACATDTNYQECVSKRMTIKKEPTEEEKLLAIPNKKKPPRLKPFFSNIDQYFTVGESQNYENIRIYTQLKLEGAAEVDKKVLLACYINEINGTIIYPENAFTEIKKNDLNWWQDIKCQPSSKLKSNNKVEFVAKWRQFAKTKYPNYFMDQGKLNNILEKYITPEYIHEEFQCKFSQDKKKCLNVLQKSLYSQIAKFDNIKRDYSNYERKAIYEDEAAAIIIENTAPELVIGVQGGKTFNLMFSVENYYRNGEIVNVNSIKIDTDFITKTKNCDILEENNEEDNDEYKYKIKKEKLESIEWDKIKYDKQKIIGSCELKIDKKIEDPIRVNIKGKIDFDYQLINEFDVPVYN